jgi:hypothetical protein
MDDAPDAKAGALGVATVTRPARRVTMDASWSTC